MTIDFKIMAKAKKMISKSPLGSLAIDFRLSAREISRQSKLLGNYINHSTVNDHLSGSKVDIDTLKIYHKIFLNIDENLPFTRLFSSEIPTYEVAFTVNADDGILKKPDIIESSRESVILYKDAVKTKNSKAIIVNYPRSEPYIIFFDTINDINFDNGLCIIVDDNNKYFIVRMLENNKNSWVTRNYFSLEEKTLKNLKKIYPLTSIRLRNFEIVKNN